MVPLSEEEMEEIVKRDMPGFRLAKKSIAKGFSKSAGVDSSTLKPEADTPDINALREKYFGEKSSDEDAADSTSDNPGDVSKGGGSDDDEIVAVEPEAGRDSWDRGSRPKSVVLSGSKKRVIGSQG